MEEVRKTLLLQAGLNTSHITDYQFVKILQTRVTELKLPSINEYLGLFKSNSKEIFELYFHVRNAAISTSDFSEVLTKEISHKHQEISDFPGVAYRCGLMEDNRVIYISKNVVTITGYSDKDFVSRKVTYRDLILEDYKSSVDNKLEEAIQNKTNFQITYPIKYKNSIKWIWEQGYIIDTEDGNSIMEGLLLDITDKIAIEQKLNESKKFVEKVASCLPSAIYIYQHTTNQFIFQNSKAKSFLSADTDTEYGISDYFEKLVHPDDEKKLFEFRQNSSKIHKDHVIEIEFRVKSHKNNWVWVRVTESAFNQNMKGDITENIGNIIDITNQKNTEQDISESKKNLRALIDNSTHYYHLVDDNYKIIIVNKLAEQNTIAVTGRNIDPGMDIRDFVPPQLQNDFENHYKAALSGKTVHVEKEVKFSEKYTPTYDLRYIPAKDDQGNIFGVVMSTMDISDRVKLFHSLEESNNLIESINQNIKEGLYRSTQAKGIVYANKAFKEMFGYTEDELYSGKFNSDVLYVMPKRRTELAELILENKSFQNEEVEFKHKNGKRFWALVSSILTQDNQGNLYFDGAIRDITEQKRISHELVLAKRRAEEMNRLKSNFLANMSHEIRTPINGIIGLTQIMEMEENIDEVKNHLDLLRTSGERLLNTITSILDLSRLEAQEEEFQLSSINVNAFIQESIEFYEVLAKKKGIDLKTKLKANEDLTLANESILTQIMNNLVGNAIKFTERGTVEIVTSTDGQFITIYVKDTGIGISEEFLPKVFLPFIQESSGINRKFEGSGLGLSICKRYAEQLGGNLRAESKLGKGSKFTLELPLYYE